VKELTEELIKIHAELNRCGYSAFYKKLDNGVNTFYDKIPLTDVALRKIRVLISEDIETQSHNIHEQIIQKLKLKEKEKGK
jgi:hypothetical protein